jgi:hypothetical protein
VVAQAIQDMLSGNCQLAFGWTRQRLVKELLRLMAQKVRQLHRLTEAQALRSEWEVVSPNEAGELLSILDPMPDTRVERRHERAELKQEIVEYLRGEPELAAVFECLWLGITRPSDIARRVGIDERAAVCGRKRLDRKLAAFSKARAEGK